MGGSSFTALPPFTKEPCVFKAKPASKTVRARAIKAIKAAVQAASALAAAPPPSGPPRGGGPNVRCAHGTPRESVHMPPAAALQQMHLHVVL